MKYEYRYRYGYRLQTRLYRWLGCYWVAISIYVLNLCMYVCMNTSNKKRSHMVSCIPLSSHTQQRHTLHYWPHQYRRSFLCLAGSCCPIGMAPRRWRQGLSRRHLRAGYLVDGDEKCVGVVPKALLGAVAVVHVVVHHRHSLNRGRYYTHTYIHTYIHWIISKNKESGQHLSFTRSCSGSGVLFFYRIRVVRIHTYIHVKPHWFVLKPLAH